MKLEEDQIDTLVMCNKKTRLLVSFLDENGYQIDGAPLKESYSALTPPI